MKNRLREIRKNRGLSPSELGKRIGKSETQVIRLENGTREFTLKLLLNICGILNCTADELIDIPVKGINKAKCDPTLMDATVAFLLEACKRYGVKPRPKDLAKWTTLVYNDTVDLRLSIHQSKGLAKTLVMASRKSKH
jgi:transcriptional regulator with XRE-family HTH domain